MKRGCFIFLMSFVTGFGFGQARIEFVETEHDFGEFIYDGFNYPRHRFIFINTGNEPLVISEVKSDQSTNYLGIPVGPDDSGWVDIIYTTRVEGSVSTRIQIYSNAANNKEPIQLKFSGDLVPYKCDSLTAASIGISLVHIDYGYMPVRRQVLEFNLSATQTARHHEVVIEEMDEALTMSDTTWYSPFDHMTTPGRLFFRCFAETVDKYRIIVNERTGEKAWLKKDTNITLMSWLTFFQGSDCIGNFTRQPIREKPDDKSAVVCSGQDIYCFNMEPLVINGEWLKVNTDNGCTVDDFPEGIESKTGWIRWYADNKVILSWGFNE